MNTFIKVVGLVTFSILFIFSLILFRERVITFDMAAQEMYLFTTHSFVLNIRFGAGIPQIVPLVLYALNCPLKCLLMAYSATYVVFYFLFFLVIGFVLRQRAVALIFLLSTLLVVNDTFYWIQSELPQGLAWLMLYYAYIEKRGIGDITRRPGLHFILVLLIQFFHPLMFFPILYVLVYATYSRYKFDLSFYKWPVIIALGDFGIRMWASKFSEYESSKLSSVGGLNWFKSFCHKLFNVDVLMSVAHKPSFIAVLVLVLLAIIYISVRRTYLSVSMFLFTAFILAICLVAKHMSHQIPGIAKELHFAKSDYLVYWMVFLFVGIALTYKRKILPVLMLITFTFGYLLLICVTNQVADKFYLENMMLPIGIFVLLPFVEIILGQAVNFGKPIKLMLVCLIGIRLAFIFNTHTLYTNRLDWYRHKFDEMDKLHTQRLMILDKSIPMDTLIMTWASGYESLLLSSLDGPAGSKSIVIDYDLSAYRPYLTADTLTLAKWGVWSKKDLSQNYFSMYPGEYKLLP